MVDLDVIENVGYYSMWAASPRNTKSLNEVWMDDTGRDELAVAVKLVRTRGAAH